MYVFVTDQEAKGRSTGEVRTWSPLLSHRTFTWRFAYQLHQTAVIKTLQGRICENLNVKAAGSTHVRVICNARGNGKCCAI